MECELKGYWECFNHSYFQYFTNLEKCDDQFWNFKNETLDDAFIRLVREELGIESGGTRADAKFLGVFEHFYDDCVFGDDVSTHYVVIGYELYLTSNFTQQLPLKQHLNYQLFEEEKILKSENVNQYTKNYFKISKSESFNE